MDKFPGKPTGAPCGIVSRLLTTRQVDELRQLRPSILANWRWRGQGPPHVRLSPRTIRYRLSGLEAFVEGRMCRSSAEAR